METEIPDNRYRATSAETTLPHAAEVIWRETRGMVRDGLLLAVLESHRVARTFVMLAAGALALMILVSTAWLGTMFACVSAAVDQGASLLVSIVLAVIFNLLLAGGLAAYLRQRRRDPLFDATLRQLRGKPSQSEHE
jgi:uncharacterized membrane protein YqjE